jgi:hypothetical protein
MISGAAGGYFGDFHPPDGNKRMDVFSASKSYKDGPISGLWAERFKNAFALVFHRPRRGGAAGYL